jgi:HSP20 family protein
MLLNTDFSRFGLLDPWRTIEKLNRAASGILAQSESEFPAVNVWADSDKAIITSELPGIDAGEVDISVNGKSITVRGSRKSEDACEGECYHRQERWYGQFSRTIDLPYLIDTEKVEARVNKGVLHLTVPRAEADKPRKIAVKFV